MTTTKTNHGGAGNGTSGDGLGERVREAGERIVDFTDDVAQKLDPPVSALGSFLRQHPFAAMAAGVGFGYLFARFVHR